MNTEDENSMGWLHTLWPWVFPDKNKFTNEGANGPDATKPEGEKKEEPWNATGKSNSDAKPSNNGDGSSDGQKPPVEDPFETYSNRKPEYFQSDLEIPEEALRQ